MRLRLEPIRLTNRSPYLTDTVNMNFLPSECILQDLLKKLKSVEMPLYFKDPGVNILTQNSSIMLLHWLWKDSCFRDRYCNLPWSWWIWDIFILLDLISIWETMNQNNKRALLEIHTKTSLLLFTFMFTVIRNQPHPSKSTSWFRIWMSSLTTDQMVPV